MFFWGEMQILRDKMVNIGVIKAKYLEKKTNVMKPGG